MSHPQQPAITRFAVTNTTPRPATGSDAAGVEFQIAYQVTWPGPLAAPCRWRLDLALFEIDLVDPVHAPPDYRATRTADDDVSYASLTEKGHRILGPDATASILLELDDNTPASAPVIRDGTAVLFATEEAIDIARAKGELPALNWDGDVYEALDFDPIIKARAHLRPIEPGPVTGWSE
jgi:hypothetical protein